MIYVINSRSNNTSIIDGKTYQVVDTVPVGDKPFIISFNPKTNMAYITNQDKPYSIYSIDTSAIPTNRIIETWICSK